jgi:DNA-binding YbaB/EbfC family protein
MGERVKGIRASLAAEIVGGAAGGDMVVVEVTGLGEVQSIRLHPELVQRNDQELMEELIPAAMNEALAKVRQLHVEKMREATGGIDLPGLDDVLSNLH